MRCFPTLEIQEVEGTFLDTSLLVATELGPQRPLLAQHRSELWVEGFKMGCAIFACQPTLPERHSRTLPVTSIPVAAPQLEQDWFLMELRDWNDRDFDPSKGPIHVRVGAVEELFNPMDPQPLHLRDLDSEVAGWISEWAEEQHGASPVTINVVVAREASSDTQTQVTAGIKNHFRYQRWAAARRLSRLWRDGRISLVIGLTALISLTTASRVLEDAGNGAFLRLAREGLGVAGWVGMMVRDFDNTITSWRW